MKKILIISTLIILILVSNKEYNKILIPNDSIRIRVIANSNSIEDQLVKLKVKNNIQKELYKEIKDKKDINEVRNTINSNLKNIEKSVSNTIKSNNFNINYGMNYFPEKELFGINYKEGNYESLVVNLGNSEGNNWWCVLFPPLCTIEVKQTDKDFVEYKSKVLEILNHYK